jgi:hypothetical protein
MVIVDAKNSVFLVFEKLDALDAVSVGAEPVDGG